MPLYDFTCRICSKEFELLVMGSAKPACPHCQSTELTKQMSTFAVGNTGRRRDTEAGREAGDGAGSGSKCSGCAGTSCSTCH